MSTRARWRCSSELSICERNVASEEEIAKVGGAVGETRALRCSWFVLRMVVARASRASASLYDGSREWERAIARHLEDVSISGKE